MLTNEQRAHDLAIAIVTAKMNAAESEGVSIKYPIEKTVNNVFDSYQEAYDLLLTHFTNQ